MVVGSLQINRVILHPCQKTVYKETEGVSTNTIQACKRKSDTKLLSVISVPFHAVFIDLVGKIEPASAEGHSFILTILDAATHFAVAVPLGITNSR
jgi:hypothetical protein